MNIKEIPTLLHIDDPSINVEDLLHRFERHLDTVNDPIEINGHTYKPSEVYFRTDCEGFISDLEKFSGTIHKLDELDLF